MLEKLPHRVNVAHSLSHPWCPTSAGVEFHGDTRVLRLRLPSRATRKPGILWAQYPPRCGKSLQWLAVQMHWRAKPEQMCCEYARHAADSRREFQTRQTCRQAAARDAIPETPRFAARVISNDATLALRRRMKKHDREKAVLPHRPEPRSLANLCGVQRVWQRKT